MTWKVAAAWIGLAIATAGTAVAQTPPASKPAPPAAAKPVTPGVPNDPAQTTASYGDWVLRCVRQGEGIAASRSCEVMQSLVLQGQQQPVAQLALGSADKSDPLRLTVVVPTAISLSRGPRIVAVPGNAPLHELTWRRCLPTGCFADVALTADAIKMMRARSEPLHLTFKDAGERDVALPFSLRGLAQALDALSKEAAVR